MQLETKRCPIDLKQRGANRQSLDPMESAFTVPFFIPRILNLFKQADDKVRTVNRPHTPLRATPIPSFRSSAPHSKFPVNCIFTIHTVVSIQRVRRTACAIATTISLAWQASSRLGV